MTSYSPYPDITVPETDLWSFLFLRPDRPFPESKVIFTDVPSNRAYTFNDLRKLSLHFGRTLQSRFQYQKGDVLTVVSGNSIDLPPVIWGSVSIGAVVSPLNPNFSASEIVHYLTDAGAKAVVTQKAQYDAVLQAATRAGLSKDRIIVLDDATQGIWESDASALLDAAFAAPHISPVQNPEKDLLFLVYSSGTTGLPKGVMLSHRNVVANLIQMASMDNGADGKPFLTHEDKALAFLPFFHIYGITGIVNSGLYLGMNTFIMPRFDLQTVCETVQSRRISYLYVVPPVALQLVQSPLVDRYDLRSLRLLNSAAAALSLELIRGLRDKRGITIRQQYGMSECSPCTHSQTYTESIQYPGSVGRLIPNVTAKYAPIAGETPKSANPKEGELWVKGPNVFLGYYNNPTANAESFSEDGFYKTGDVGCEDAYGNFTITDRIKELIKYNGFQVAPAELEDILLGHPAVGDCAVVGIPSGQAGSELPRAYVKPAREDLTGDNVAVDIVAFVKAKVVAYKQLRGGVVFVEAIPRNPSGKILRRELKKLFASKI